MSGMRRHSLASEIGRAGAVGVWLTHVCQWRYRILATLIQYDANHSRIVNHGHHP